MAKVKAKKETDAAPEKAAPSVAVLQEIKSRQIKLAIKGLTPLVLHGWDVKAIAMIEDRQQQKAVEPKAAKDPKAEFEACKYLDLQGRECLPARAFKKAMTSAATSIKDKRFPKTLIRQAIFVVGDLVPIIAPKPAIMRTDMVRLNKQGADVRYRPEYDPWGVELTIDFNENVVSLEQVVNLANLAGYAVGVGEWRPEKDGNFGRFTVSKKGG